MFFVYDGYEISYNNPIEPCMYEWWAEEIEEYFGTYDDLSDADKRFIDNCCSNIFMEDEEEYRRDATLMLNSCYRLEEIAIEYHDQCEADCEKWDEDGNLIEGYELNLDTEGCDCVYCLENWHSVLDFAEVNHDVWLIEHCMKTTPVR